VEVRVREFIGLVCLLLIFVASALAVLGVIVAGQEYVTVRGKMAAVEQLREDSQRVRGADAAGVLQLVAQANGEIAFHKALNAHPLVGWSIPDDWADVRPIRLRTLRDIEPGTDASGSPASGERPSSNFGYTPNTVESERFIRSLEKGTNR